MKRSIAALLVVLFVAIGYVTFSEQFFSRPVSEGSLTHRSGDSATVPPAGSSPVSSTGSLGEGAEAAEARFRQHAPALGEAPVSPLAAQPAGQHSGNQREQNSERLIWLPSIGIDGPAAPPAQPEEPQQAPVYGVCVVNTFPHDPRAFTQGLEMRDGELFEGTGLRGRSSLRRVDLETGDVLQQVDLPAQYFGEGITVFDDRIFQLTWTSGIGFIYDRETFTRVGTVTYANEGWGLTHDEERLIMSDGTSNLTLRDPETFAEIGRIQVRDGEDPIARLNELEYIEGEIWANIWLTDRIARIDPVSGKVVAWLDLAGLVEPEDRPTADAVLNGIAYDAENRRIFVTGKLWPHLFEIEVIQQAVAVRTQRNPTSHDKVNLDATCPADSR